MRALAVTMGDPAGIGGELTLKAWRELRSVGPAFVALDDPERLRHLARHLGYDVPIHEVGSLAEGAEDFAAVLPVLPVRLAATPVPGRPDPANAPAVIASIERATKLALAGEAGGVVTNPIHKAGLYGAGFGAPGHTEFIAGLCGTETPVMMLLNDELRVVPVTVHMSLRHVLETLSTERIVRVGRVTAAALKSDCGFEAPRLAFAGLNPHAGEDGTMGDEETRIIGPAIEILRAEGIDARGPFAADSLFSPLARHGYDVALGMYHDQALVAIKTLDMRHGVNVTLGLPIVRTSPDHGTAFPIAGKGVADPASLIAAIELAGTHAERRAR